MKKILAIAALIFAVTCAWAQDNISISESIPKQAADILLPRLVQMLEAGGKADTPLKVEADVTDRMETPGSISQTALTIDLIISSGEVAETFTIKGVGDTEADAWVSAVKKFLPRSKNAQIFVEKLGF